MRKDPVRLRTGLLCLATALTAAALFAADLNQTFGLPDGSTLRLGIPAGWRVEARGPAGLPPTLHFSPVSGEGFKVLVTVFPLPDPASPLREKEGIRTFVEAMGAGTLPTAVETKLEILELQGAQGNGYFFSVTDREEEKGPDDYRFLTSGVMAAGALRLGVTMLRHRTDDGTLEAALEMLRTAEQIPPPKP